MNPTVNPHQLTSLQNLLQTPRIDSRLSSLILLCKDALTTNPVMSDIETLFEMADALFCQIIYDGIVGKVSQSSRDVSSALLILLTNLKHDFSDKSDEQKKLRRRYSLGEISTDEFIQSFQN